MLTPKSTILSVALLCIFFTTAAIAQENNKDTNKKTEAPMESSETPKERKPLGENEGIVRFLVDVDNGYFEVLINDTLWLRRYKDTLPAGTYEAKVWSPGYVTAPIEFTVKAGESVDKFVNMVYTNERMAFEKDYKSYRNTFHKNFTVPASVSLAATLFTGYSMMRAYDLRKKGDLEIAKYTDSPIASELVMIKENVAEINRKYNMHRSMFYVGSGVTVLCWAATIYMYKRFKRNNVEPTFTPKSPWKDKFSMVVSPWGCGMILRI